MRADGGGTRRDARRDGWRLARWRLRSGAQWRRRERRRRRAMGSGGGRGRAVRRSDPPVEPHTHREWHLDRILDRDPHRAQRDRRETHEPPVADRRSTRELPPGAAAQALYAVLRDALPLPDVLAQVDDPRDDLARELDGPGRGGR